MSVGCSSSSEPAGPENQGPQLICSGSWTNGWPQVCHDGNPFRSSHFLVFADRSTAEARELASQIAEEALAAVMEVTETGWDDYDFHPNYTEDLIHVMMDYGQMNQSGLAYPHGMIVRALDSPRFSQFYTPQSWRNVLQHELTHVVEFLLIGSPNQWSTHAVWLREGFANWGAGLHSVTSLSQLEAWRSQMSGFPGGGNPIGIYRFSDMPQSIRDANNTVSYYPFFELATRYLIDPNGHGGTVATLKGMFEDIEDGMSWSRSFEEAFGLTADEYEASFWELMETYLPS